MIPWSLDYKQACASPKHLCTMKKTQEFAIPLPSHIRIKYHNALYFVQQQVTASWKMLTELISSEDRSSSIPTTATPRRQQAVRKILDMEVRQETFWKFSQLLKGSRDAGLSKNICPNFIGQCEEITKMEELFQVLLAQAPLIPPHPSHLQPLQHLWRNPYRQPQLLQ